LTVIAYFEGDGVRQCRPFHGAMYGLRKRYHKKKTMTVHGEPPILITVMDTAEKINKVIPILDELMAKGSPCCPA
jgi:PII-like signaling protein